MGKIGNLGRIRFVNWIERIYGNGNKSKQRVTELKIRNTRVLANVYGKNMWLWVDSGSPVTIFSMSELTRGMGRSNLHLIKGKDEFLDYNNNRIHILGKAEATIKFNGWVTQQKISVIAGNDQSILGRDLMASMGLELVQRDRVMTVTGYSTNDKEEHDLDEWQSYFCKLFPKFFSRIGHKRNAKVQANFFDVLKLVQQKRRRVPISLQD